MFILRSWGFIKERPWALSFMLHATFFFILGLTALLSGCQRRPEVHVFTLVNDVSANSASAGAAPIPVNQPQYSPSPSSKKSLSMPSLEDLFSFFEEDDSKKEKTPEKKSPAIQDSKKETKNKVQETIKSKEAKKTDSSKLTYDEFMKQQPKAAKKVSDVKDGKSEKKQPANLPPSAHFDVSKIKENLKKMVASTTISAVSPSATLGTGTSNAGSGAGAGGANPALLTALERYLSSLKGNIDRAWQKPEKVSRQDLNAVVEFYIDPQGKISQHKLVKASGDADFDSSVLNAFKVVGQSACPAGLPPGNQAGWYRLTFHLN